MSKEGREGLEPVLALMKSGRGFAWFCDFALMSSAFGEQSQRALVLSPFHCSLHPPPPPFKGPQQPWTKKQDRTSDTPITLSSSLYRLAYAPVTLHLPKRSLFPRLRLHPLCWSDGTILSALVQLFVCPLCG